MMCTIILKWGEYMPFMRVPHCASMSTRAPYSLFELMACLVARVMEDIERAKILNPLHYSCC